MDNQRFLQLFSKSHERAIDNLSLRGPHSHLISKFPVFSLIFPCQTAHFPRVNVSGLRMFHMEN